MAERCRRDVAGLSRVRRRRAPCRLFTASLEDALGVAGRPNMPGTVDAWPNWRWPLPVTLEGLRGHAGLRRIAAVMRGGRRGAGTGR